MLKLAYAASTQDLTPYSTGSIRIDKITGMPPAAYKRTMATRSPDQVTGPRWITLRPGLSSGILFYGVIRGETGILVCISSRQQSRYYWLGNVKRETVIIDAPSQTIDEVIENLFRGLLTNDSPSFVAFYRNIAHLVSSHFVTENVHKSFTVEGSFKQVGPSFIAEIEWRPRAPAELIVSSTLDQKHFRKVSLLSHPIAEVHKQCHR